MNKSLFIFLLSLLSVSCTTTAVKEKETLSQSGTSGLIMVAHNADLPAWLTPTVTELGSMSNSSGQIIECTYRGNTVYYIPSVAFHKRSVLYHADGTVLCYPDGGITGKDSRCPDFHSAKTNVKVVWSNDQNRNH